MGIGPGGMNRRQAALALTTLATQALAGTPPGRRVPVLVYHRFASQAVDSMTVRTANFASHLEVIRRLGARVVPLRDVVAWRLGLGGELPERAMALTADDAHRSQVETMAPMLRDTGWPMSLFVYPSAISNASYAMTWQQLAALKDDGRYDIQSHTYWHPNLLRERRVRSPADFERFATQQMEWGRDRLRQRLGVNPTLLAWPFGLTDDGLMALAARLGFQASFILGNRHVSLADPLHALPRHLMTDVMAAARLERLLANAFDQTHNR